MARECEQVARSRHLSRARSSAYIDELTSTEAGASVKPVILLQLVDLDPFAIVGSRHLQRHRMLRSALSCQHGQQIASFGKISCSMVRSVAYLALYGVTSLVGLAAQAVVACASVDHVA